ncbi:hypothetical protein GQ53DRAFT_807451 [Thozetella sp. PMI_491]|nr:hypothetical protein GQ53DRAFT_807451 [Thozetella sp. PMI_491]
MRFCGFCPRARSLMPDDEEEGIPSIHDHPSRVRGGPQNQQRKGEFGWVKRAAMCASIVAWCRRWEWRRQFCAGPYFAFPLPREDGIIAPESESSQQMRPSLAAAVWSARGRIGRVDDKSYRSLACRVCLLPPSSFLSSRGLSLAPVSGLRHPIENVAGTKLGFRASPTSRTRVGRPSLNLSKLQPKSRCVGELLA